MRRHPLVVVASALALGLMLSGCESLDLPVDWFNKKKPLVGERKQMFPEGVPGVPHGVPPDLQQGYQPPPEPPPQVAEAPPDKPKPKPKPKPRPRQAEAPARPATTLTVQPEAQQTASQPPPGQSIFPDPPPPRR